MEKIDARKLPPEALEHIRRQAFVLRKRGYTWAHIAEVCGVHVGTVLNPDCPLAIFREFGAS
jgi:hypothetical protein